MKLSQLQKDLIALFKAYEMTEDEVIGVMLALKPSPAQKEMLRWIEQNTAATPDEVVKAAMKIYKKWG